MDTIGDFEIQTRQHVANAHRIVIKLGTNVIMPTMGQQRSDCSMD